MANGIKQTSDEWDVIHVYSRRQAIEDGVLVDVTEAAREVGFIHPTAVTRAVWERYVKVPEAVPWQDERGRLHDVVWMARCGIPMGCNQPAVVFRHARRQRRQRAERKSRLKAVVGPGDSGEPVITIMLPEED